MCIIVVEDIRPIWNNFVCSFKSEVHQLAKNIDVTNIHSVHHPAFAPIYQLYNDNLLIYNARLTEESSDSYYVLSITFESEKDYHWFLLKWS